jgi:hypothetical protein
VNADRKPNPSTLAQKNNEIRSIDDDEVETGQVESRGRDGNKKDINVRGLGNAVVLSPLMELSLFFYTRGESFWVLFSLCVPCCWWPHPRRSSVKGGTQARSSLLFSVQGPPACPKWETSKFQGVEEIAYGSEWGSLLVLTVDC